MFDENSKVDSTNIDHGTINVGVDASVPDTIADPEGAANRAKPILLPHWVADKFEVRISAAGNSYLAAQATWINTLIQGAPKRLDAALLLFTRKLDLHKSKDKKVTKGVKQNSKELNARLEAYIKILVDTWDAKLEHFDQYAANNWLWYETGQVAQACCRQQDLLDNVLDWTGRIKPGDEQPPALISMTTSLDTNAEKIAFQYAALKGFSEERSELVTMKFDSAAYEFGRIQAQSQMKKLQTEPREVINKRDNEASQHIAANF